MILDTIFTPQFNLVMVLVSTNHYFHGIMAFVNISYSHGSSPTVGIVVMALVNIDLSFDCGYDFYTHHKIIRMSKSFLTITLR